MKKNAATSRSKKFTFPFFLCRMNWNVAHVRFNRFFFFWIWIWRRKNLVNRKKRTFYSLINTPRTPTFWMANRKHGTISDDRDMNAVANKKKFHINHFLLGEKWNGSLSERHWYGHCAFASCHFANICWSSIADSLFIIFSFDFSRRLSPSVRNDHNKYMHVLFWIECTWSCQYWMLKCWKRSSQRQMAADRILVWEPIDDQSKHT